MADLTPADRTFDRIPSDPDPRDEDYPIRALLTTEQIRKPRSYTWRSVTLDQGREGACVAFDSTMEAAARPKPFFGDPVRNPPDVATLNALALGVYETCREIDGHRFPAGATQRAGMKAGQRHGFWTNYHWAVGSVDEKVRDVFLAIGYKGPVCLAADWHEGMDHPDASGFGAPTGRIRGGHSFLLPECSVNRSRYGVWYVRTPNSWGGGGQIKLSEESLGLLFEGGAEAGIPDGRLMP